MSGGCAVLQLTQEDARLMISADVHKGGTSVNHQMVQYVFGCNSMKHQIICLNKIWEKILLAARAIAAIQHPSDICAVGCRPFTQRAVLKFSQYTDSTAMAGRFTPGAFTNQKQACFREPKLLVVSDPVSDHRPILEASRVNIPVIAFCSPDSPLKCIDIAIPCNNKSIHSIAVCWWLLTREVRRIRGKDIRSQPWNVLPDLFLYRDPNETEVDQTVEVEEAPLDALPGADVDVAETWNADPTNPVGGLDDICIGDDFRGARGGWSNLDSDPNQAW